MASCNYKQQSFFRDVFDPVKDFGGYKQIYELPEKLQLEYDPVGFYFFHKDVVYSILNSLKLLNNRRIDLRDLLREMDRIWRYNSQQRVILNELDHKNRGFVAQRVNELIRITRQKLDLETRVDNLVTGDIIRNWEFFVPSDNPAAPVEKQSGTMEMRVPRIDKKITPPRFRHVDSFDRRVRIR